MADRKVNPGNAVYTATKFGARALHEAMLVESRGTGVRATLVSPGPTDTAIWDPYDPDHRPGFTPRARMLRPEHIAGAVVWALSQPAEVNVDELRLSST
jgi:NADP-dependent 3-hydroxy acid dehydrogenase YdfG